MADEFGSSGQITAIGKELFLVQPLFSIGSSSAYYPQANPLLPLAHHDAKSKTPAAKSIPVVVRTTMRGWATYVMRNPLDGLRPSAREESMGHDIET